MIDLAIKDPSLDPEIVEEGIVGAGRNGATIHVHQRVLLMSRLRD